MDDTGTTRGHRWFAALYGCLERGDKSTPPRRRRIVGGASGRVLEVGCGTGVNFDYYDWPRIDSLDATEPDPYMLRRAEARLAQLDAAVRAKVRLHQLPAEALAFDDASFDAVVCTLVLCSVADPARAIGELYRVLKPGGALRLIEHVAASGGKGRFQQTIQPVYGWLAAGCQLHCDTESALRDAGFRLDVNERFDLLPIAPAFEGVAYKPT